MTYKPCIVNLSPLQEGNLADFLNVNFNESFPLADVGEVVLSIRTKGDKSAYLVKKLSEGKIIVTNQNVLIPFLPEDSAGHAGDYDYELDFYNEQNQPFATLKGKGTIEREIK